MSPAPQTSVGYWQTLRLLLGAARKRGNGRRRRQREVLAQRSGRQSATSYGFLGFAIAVLFMGFIHVFAGVLLLMTVDVAQHLTVEQAPNIPRYAGGPAIIAEHQPGNDMRIQRLAHRHSAPHALQSLTRTGPVPLMFGSFILLWWGVMLVFQGEGLELDIQRRRNPLWEWVFSHPVPPGAVFFAEILTPIAANPVYWTSPLFPGVVYGLVYGPLLGVLAVFLVGIPVTVAAACLGKALEIGVILRFAPRTRGALIGLMSWVGYSSLMLFLFGSAVIPRLIPLAAKSLAPLSDLPWPFLQLFLGGPWPSAVAPSILSALLPGPPGFSYFAGVLACWLASLLVATCAVWFTVWGAQRGLAGATGDIAPARVRSRSQAIDFGREPLYRKEFLWFVRDRSAIVQTILIPLSIAGFQMFNLRNIFNQAGSAWNYLCGAAIFFGTYFLWILGPKSLASEGQALWIALTWPRGLESLLKAKAWLWSLISSAMVLVVLVAAAFLFPAEIPKIALVGVGWWFFARSMARKSVTLVTVASSSGEQTPIPWSRRGATQIGMLTFALGVITGQWHLAIVGIVFSWITAAAMWQNFRARLPYLYDPWSEKLPPPPTLMHAMVAISLCVDGNALFAAAAVKFAPPQELAFAMPIAYALSATLVFFGTAKFLTGRGVVPNQVWTWIEGLPPTPRLEKSLDDYLADPDVSFFEKYGLTGSRLLPALLLGLATGLALGVCAHGYTAVLHHIAGLRNLLRNAEQGSSITPGLRLAYAVMAVGFAPVAEEYLFRGLLYRALDRDWGGWRAVLGAAAFFTVYHPVLGWPPVFCLGAVNCLLFKKTRRLLPCILLHMTYNAVVLTRLGKF